MIDYSKLDLRSPMWWKRWRYLLNAIADVETGELLQTAYRYQLALVSNSKLSPEDFSAVQRNAKDYVTDISAVYRPWLGKSKEDRHIRDVNDFKKAWEQIAGFSVDDEEAMAEWEANVENVTEQAITSQTDAEKEELQRQHDFAQVVREVQEKRLRQQGRLR